MKSLNQKSEKAISKNLIDKFAEAVQRDSGYLCGLNSPVIWKTAGIGLVGADNDKMQAYQARREQQMASYAEKVVPVLKQLKSQNISYTANAFNYIQSIAFSDGYVVNISYHMADNGEINGVTFYHDNVSLTISAESEEDYPLPSVIPVAVFNP
jgi:hypothetical protein